MIDRSVSKATKESTPAVGDFVYVPSIEKELGTDVGWESLKKKGGLAVVGRIQKVSEKQHLVFVIEYGGYGMWWETFLEPKQEELRKKYGLGTRAQTLLR